LESTTSGSGGESIQSGQVVGSSLAEDKGVLVAVLGGESDGVGLASNDAGWESVNGWNGHGDSGKEGGARDDGLEETHVDGDGGVN